MKTCSRALWISDWGDSSSFSKTKKTISTQPRYQRSGFRTILSTSLSGPAGALTGIWLNIFGGIWKCLCTDTWEVVQRGRGATVQSPSYATIFKKSWGCNCCQRSMNIVLSKGCNYSCILCCVLCVLKSLHNVVSTKFFVLTIGLGGSGFGWVKPKTIKMVPVDCLLGAQYLQFNLDHPTIPEGSTASAHCPPPPPLRVWVKSDGQI